MAVQTINYANIPPQGAEGITSGFNAVYGPIAAKRKAEADALAAKMLQLQLLYEPQKYATEKAYKEAQTQELLQNIDLYAAIMQQAGLTPGATTETTNAAGRENNQNNPNLFANSGLLNELLRSKLRLGPESPEQAQQRAIETHKANTMFNKELEKSNPSGATQTRHESVMDIAVPLFKSIDDMFSKYDESQRIFEHGSYPKIRDATTQRLMVAENYLGNITSAEEAKNILTPAKSEDKPTYEKRVRHELEKLAPQIATYYKEKGMEIPQELKNYLPGGKYSSESMGKSNKKMSSKSKNENPSFVRMQKDGRYFLIPAERAQEAIKDGATYAK